jgi:hypothetical protein
MFPSAYSSREFLAVILSHITNYYMPPKQTATNKIGAIGVRLGLVSAVATHAIIGERISSIGNHRIQMRAGEGCFTVAEGNIQPNYSVTVQVRIEDMLNHCARARLAGARILTEHIYGERQYDAEDFYGHRWNFTETIADVEPETYGGTAVNL